MVDPIVEIVSPDICTKWDLTRVKLHLRKYLSVVYSHGSCLAAIFLLMHLVQLVTVLYA